MLLQYGSGLPVGYGRFSTTELYELLRLQVYSRMVGARGFSTEQRGQSNLLANMVYNLTNNFTPLRPQRNHSSL